MSIDTFADFTFFRLGNIRETVESRVLYYDLVC